MALKAVVFAAIGTCGQRCTSIRRLYVHESKYDELKDRLVQAYQSLKIGDPLDSGNVCGPLHTKAAVKEFEEGLKTILSQGGKVVFGGKRIGERPEGNYVQPTLVEIDPKAPIVQEELFVPILYLFKFTTFDEAIALNNGVPQGLSRQSEQWERISESRDSTGSSASTGIACGSTGWSVRASA